MATTNASNRSGRGREDRLKLLRTSGQPQPERHLHQLAQRLQSRSLGELARKRGAQTLIVSHSVPFINQSSALAYVSRTATGSSTVRPTKPDELTAMTEVAMDLGLDRGELLASVGVFLLVEGVSDQHVLEGLYGDRLRRMGVAVIPIHGVTQTPQVLDSQFLTRYSTAKLAAMFDELDENELGRLTADRSFRLDAATHKKTERRELAKLLEAAANEGRDLLPLPLPVPDIFFVLDPDAIRAEFAGSAPEDYPGHRTAQAAYRDIANGDIAKGTRWKTFLNSRYGIPLHDVSWYRRVADRMRRDSRLPPELEEVVGRLELLTLDPP